MNSVKGRGIVRRALVLLVACGLTLAGTAASGAAATEEGTQQGGVSATLGRITAGGGAVVHDRRRTGPVMAGLFEMKVDGGGTLQTYCVDILTNTVDGAKYKETGWGESSLHDNPNAGRIRWILQHSYPQVNDLAALAKDSGAGTLDANSAAAGTQIAVWRYSDSVKVDAVSPEAQKLADYLYGHAEDTPEPQASLTLTPAAVSGRAGGRIGPVTVRTDASSVTVTPSAAAVAKNVRLVDKAGKPVTTTGNGGEVYFDVPAGAPDGSAALKATAATKVPVGRAFIGDHTRTQTMILAGSSESTVSAAAGATWATKGAIPAVTARKDCAAGGVQVAVENKGDRPFTHELQGRPHTVAPGRTETTLVRVGEDQAYRLQVTGPGGFARTFSGILDCRTAETGAAEGSGTARPSAVASPAVVHKASTGGGPAAGGDLAGTGGSGATPEVAGVAIALIVVGGAAVFLLRRTEAAGDQ
ncbi:Cys-Gln thioester bond-forming surface protein [Streptomyces sp. NPDC049585]|uniref:Cys-Gln thioester bond-forming surface protein n=1 Tax=Streptomyces sp. NPDC049585 TaxID=3155154 RepID=UPI003427A839